jgi:hypothetical protein
VLPASVLFKKVLRFMFIIISTSNYNVWIKSVTRSISESDITA